MTAVFINAILLIIAFVLGYAMQPRISRKISYKKRGIATRQRAAVKRAAKGPTAKKPKVAADHQDQYINGGTTVN